MNIEDLKKTRVMRRDEIRRLTGLGDTALDEAEERGEFPAKIQLGPRAIGWLESEVLGWLAAKVAARDARRAA